MRWRRRVGVVGIVAVGLTFTAGFPGGRTGAADVETPRTATPDTCPEPEGAFTAPPDMAAALVGTWIRCSGEPFAGALVDDVGIEVTEDRRFYRVFELPDGTLARATGVEQEGTWEVVGGQVNWHLLGSGMFIRHPQLASGPPMLWLRGSLSSSRFVRWAGPAPATDAPPPETESCGVMAMAVAPTSTDQVEELVVGAWIRCAGPPIVGIEGDHIGVQFTDDGRFFRLYAGADGTIVRAEGVDQEGTWRIDGDPGNYQLSIGLLGLGGGGGFPVFFESPTRSMRLLTMIGNTDYRPWTGPAPDTGTPPGPPTPCGPFTAEIRPATAADATELLVGTWTLCGGSPPDQPTWWSSMFGPPAEAEVGLELAADGRYYRLFEQPDGTVTRGNGVGMEGTWEASINEFGGLQMAIRVGRLGSESGLVSLFEPAGFRISATGSVADYVSELPTEPPPTTAAADPLPPTGSSAAGVLLVALAVGVAGATLLLVARTPHRVRRRPID